MKNTIHIIVISAIFTMSMVGSVLAKDCDKQRGNKRMQHLSEHLQLDESQAEQVRVILKKKREKMNEIRQDTDQELKQILDKEQLEALHELRISKPAKRHHLSEKNQ